VEDGGGPKNLLNNREKFLKGGAVKATGLIGTCGKGGEKRHGDTRREEGGEGGVRVKEKPEHLILRSSEKVEVEVSARSDQAQGKNQTHVSSE